MTRESRRGRRPWASTRSMELCQAAGVRAMPVQSSQDRFDNDPHLRHREMYRNVEHPVLGSWPLQNAPFKMSETPVFNSRSGPLIGQHNKEVFEGLLGISHQELVDGFEDGTFWPKDNEHGTLSLPAGRWLSRTRPRSGLATTRERIPRRRPCIRPALSRRGPSPEFECWSSPMRKANGAASCWPIWAPMSSR